MIVFPDTSNPIFSIRVGTKILGTVILIIALIVIIYMSAKKGNAGQTSSTKMKALRKILCKKESKQIRKQITNMVFRLENGGIHLPLLTARSMPYDGMRTAGVNSGRRHRAY